MDLQFNVGDVVRLKSGGPTMTVQKIEDDGELLCVWWDDSRSKFEWTHFRPELVAK